MNLIKKIIGTAEFFWIIVFGFGMVFLPSLAYGATFSITQEHGNHPNSATTFDFNPYGPVTITNIHVEAAWRWEDGGTDGVSSAGISKAEAATRVGPFSGWLGMWPNTPPSTGGWSENPCPDGVCAFAINPGVIGFFLYGQKDDGGNGGLAPGECQGYGLPNDGGTWDYCFGISGYSFLNGVVTLTWYGVTNRDIGTFTRIRIDAEPVPYPPTNLSASCPAPGSAASLSWSPSSGATYYSLRVDNLADGWDGTCASPGGDKCVDLSSTSYSYTSTPGATYNWWVHAGNSLGLGNPADGTDFTCLQTPTGLPDLTIITSPSLNTGTLVAGNTVTFKATVKNIGGGNAIQTFRNPFNVDINSDSPPGVWDVDLLPFQAQNGLISGATKLVASGNWANIPAGTHEIGVCTDKPSSQVNESNEGNQCTAVYIVVDPVLAAMCSGAPNPATTNQTATWTASPTGGNGTYTYSWTGSDGLSGTSQAVSKTYSTSGTKTATVTVTSGSQTITSPTCSIAVNDPVLSASCSASPLSALTEESVTWTASPTGGNGTYTYSWTGSDGLSGTSQAVSKTYSSAGTKTATVTVTSGSQTITSPSCSAIISYPECSDSIDNEGDGLVDLADPGCSSPGDINEGSPLNPEGSGCTSNEQCAAGLFCVNGTCQSLPQCSDTIDNDGDTKIDLADPGCFSPSDDNETDLLPPWIKEILP